MFLPVGNVGYCKFIIKIKIKKLPTAKIVVNRRFIRKSYMPFAAPVPGYSAKKKSRRNISDFIGCQSQSVQWFRNANKIT